MYEMATGRLPFAGASPSETVSNVLENEPARLTDLAPEHPKALETIVHRLLAKRASDRYPSAIELAKELSSLVTSYGSWSTRVRRLFRGR
jgi:serine/threonine-protein kinase